MSGNVGVVDEVQGLSGWRMPGITVEMISDDGRRWRAKEDVLIEFELLHVMVR